MPEPKERPKKTEKVSMPTQDLIFMWICVVPVALSLSFWISSHALKVLFRWVFV